MKIGWVVPGGVDPGGEKRVIPWLLWPLERLARQHDVHVFAMRQPGAPSRFRLHGATIHVSRGRFAVHRAGLRILAEHARSRFDVLHGFWAWPQGYLAGWAGSLLRVPTVVHVCGGEFVSLPDLGYGDQRSPKTRRRVDAALRRASCVAAQSTPMVDAAAAAGIAAIRLPLGADPVTWEPVPPRPRDPGRPARLVSVGTLNPVKDHATLIRAAARLAADGIDFSLDMIGEDLGHGRIRDQAEKAGIAGRVRLHGFRTQRETRSIVLEADLLVQTSRHESGPVAMLEAAMAGVPAAGTAVGYNAEWAPDAAVAVPPGDDVALTAAIRGLLDDDARRMRVAELAQRLAMAENADWTANRLVRLYEELASP